MRDQKNKFNKNVKLNCKNGAIYVVKRHARKGNKFSVLLTSYQFIHTST